MSLTKNNVCLKNIVCLTYLLPSLVFAAGADIQELDFDALLDSDVQLSSVMKRLQSAHETAASVYVLSGEEIQRSGVTSVPQALTLVPGMQVRRIDSNTWAITSRATAGRYSSKLLVLIDGQSIYDPVHAGVNWETLNIPLYDIEKIEVVRGQGGLLWGSNATNGVVNIITKHSEDTRNTTIQLDTGDQINANASARYGSDLGDLGSYRIYALGKDTNASDQLNYDTEAGDSSEAAGLGGRLDLNLRDDLFLLMQGSYQDQDTGSTMVVPDLTTNETSYSVTEDRRRTFNLMARVDHYIDDQSSHMLQLAVSDDTNSSLFYEEETTKLDADYQFNTQINSVQLDMGLNYRLVDYSLQETDYVSAIGDLDNLQQIGAFGQAQFELLPDELKFIIGNKSEHNTVTGWEHQPMARIVWLPDERSSLWASVSQGVRVPSLIETDIEFLVGGAKVSSVTGTTTGDSSIDDYRIKQVIRGNEDIDAEKSFSQEIGYRYMSHNWNLDLSLFNTHSRNVLAVESDLSPYSADELEAAYLSDLLYGTSLLSGMLSSSVISQNFVSSAELDTYGGELVVGWQVSPKVKAELGYSYSRYDYHLPDGVVSAIGFDSSLQQWLLKTSTSVNRDHSLYTLMRYERGEAYGTDNFFALDISWHWQVSPSVQFGLTGNNLFYASHVEYGNTNELYTVSAYVEPSFVATLKFEF